jgi:hypothetical protein
MLDVNRPHALLTHFVLAVATIEQMRETVRTGGGGDRSSLDLLCSISSS